MLSLRELVNEDWWDDMSPEDQAAYIKKHPGSKQAQSAKDKEEPILTIYNHYMGWGYRHKWVPGAYE